MQLYERLGKKALADIGYSIKDALGKEEDFSNN
jgi:hypothetical protein